MRILLTGATGVVGSALADKWRSSDHVELLTLSRGPSNNFQERHFSVDLTKSVDLSLFDGPIDVVVHAAALVSQGQLNLEIIEKNLKMCFEAFRIADKLRAHFVNLSSISIYGRNRHETLNEKSPAHPVDFYGLSKEVCEKLLDTLNHSGKSIPTTHLRLGYVLSSKAVERYFITKILNSLKQQEKIRIVNGTSSRFAFVDVNDISLIIEKIVRADVTGVLNFAGSEFPTFLEILDHLEGATGIKSTNIEKSSDKNTIIRLCFENSKVQQAFPGFRFTNWRESLDKVVSDWRERS